MGVWESTGPQLSSQDMAEREDAKWRDSWTCHHPQYQHKPRPSCCHKVVTVALRLQEAVALIPLQWVKSTSLSISSSESLTSSPWSLWPPIMQCYGRELWALSLYSGRGGCRKLCALPADNMARGKVPKSHSQGPDIPWLTHSLENHMVISNSTTKARDIRTISRALKRWAEPNSQVPGHSGNNLLGSNRLYQEAMEHKMDLTVFPMFHFLSWSVDTWVFLVFFLVFFFF